MVPISALTTVKSPALVIPAGPPKPPNSEMVCPRMMGGTNGALPVVKVQGFGTSGAFPSGLPNWSVAPSVTSTV